MLEWRTVNREQVVGDGFGEVGRGLSGVWIYSQYTEKLKVKEPGYKERKMSIPIQMAPFGALCHLVSTSKVPST